MKNKKTILALAAFVLIAALLLGLWAANRPETAEGAKAFTVTVVHADGSEKVFSYTTDAEYLADVLLAEGLVQGESGEYGLMINTVDGETASWEENKSYWALYIGEDYATTGADGIVVTDGGEYGLVYTIG